MRFFWAFVAFVVVATPSVAAPPKVPDPIKVGVGEDYQVEITVEQGKKGAFAPGFDTKYCLFFRGYSTDPTKMSFLVRPKVKGEFRVVFWTIGEEEFSTLVINKDEGPPTPVPPNPPGPTPPGPTPPGPTPPGPTPPPIPVTSFRVFLVFESGATLTAGERAILYGNVVEDYLNSACTGGKDGWRRRDQNAPGESDPTMTAFWKTVQASAPKTPCIAIAVNDKVYLEPIDKPDGKGGRVLMTPAEVVELLKKFREGR